MRGFLESLGGIVIGVAGLVLVLFLFGLLFRSGIWVCEMVLPWLSVALWLTIVIDVVLLLPLAAFRKTRGFSGVGFAFSSYVYGLTLWIWGLLVTFVLWGGVAVVVGLALFGIGPAIMAVIRRENAIE